MAFRNHKLDIVIFTHASIGFAIALTYQNRTDGNKNHFKLEIPIFGRSRNKFYSIPVNSNDLQPENYFFSGKTKNIQNCSPTTKFCILSKHHIAIS